MNKKLILLSGKINSGKNQFAEYLKYKFENDGYSVSLDLFAKNLKDYSSEDFKPLGNVLRHKIDNIKSMVSLFYDAKLHVSNGDMLNRINSELDSLTFIDTNFYEDKTDITRVLLQLYGTDIARKRFDDNFWVNKASDRMNASDADIIIVTDVRFPNEIDDMYNLISDRDVVPIRINRDIVTNKLITSHVSESALDDYEQWFYIIDNNGSLTDLRDTSDNVVSDLMSS